MADLQDKLTEHRRPPKRDAWLPYLQSRDIERLLILIGLAAAGCDAAGDQQSAAGLRDGVAILRKTQAPLHAASADIIKLFELAALGFESDGRIDRAAICKQGAANICALAALPRRKSYRLSLRDVDALFEDRPKPKRAAKKLRSLADRQQIRDAVLELHRAGKKHKEIAAALGVLYYQVEGAVQSLGVGRNEGSETAINYFAHVPMSRNCLDCGINFQGGRFIRMCEACKISGPDAMR